MIGIGLDPLYVWPTELDAIRAAYGSTIGQGDA